MTRTPQLLLATAALLSLAGVARADGRVHVVASGDTLGALAARYHVSVDDLREANGLDGDAIRVGQELTIDGEEVIRYRVIPGDTLRCIAQRYGVSSSRLREDNPRLRSGLHVGETLRIRGGHDPWGSSRTSTASVTVGEGDTLSAIADAQHVSLAEVLALNPGLDPDHLAVGAEVQVPSVRLEAHVVRVGESVTRIARRYHVTIAQIEAWNPGLRPSRLRAGSRLFVARAARSESVGQAFCGHLVGAVALEDHEAFVLRNPQRSWASSTTVERIRTAFDMMGRRFPDGPRPRVHDLSLHDGGPIDDHRSHQSGRDVDITYYLRRGCSPREGCPLETVDPDNLDVRRQWTLFRHWLARDEVEAIYMDSALQGPLYREARRRGATAAQLEAWFQHPRGRSDANGIIRHFPNHRDHFHVRFRCGRGERHCR
ncbi:MAG: penicillin-insensitive murein endopeptidase [Sandaracinaceae bacterium]